MTENCSVIARNELENVWSFFGKFLTTSIQFSKTHPNPLSSDVSFLSREHVEY